jgi:hypothetical protein
MNRFEFPAPPNELAVVGEKKDDPEQLLLLGVDGRYYAYTLPEGDTEPVEPDENWAVEADTDELFT